MPDENIAIEVKNVAKQVHTGDVLFDVLRGVNLTNYKGEMHLITGPSGSGKTTLLSIIAGTMRFDHGDVIVFGTPLKSLNDEEITEYRKKMSDSFFSSFIY